MSSSEKVALNKHHAIVDAFFKDLLASSSEAGSFYNKPYLAFPDPIFGIDTKPGHIFDDVFWDVFHVYPLHVCHVTRLTDGPQFDEERVFEVRFKVDYKRISDGLAYVLDHIADEFGVEAKK